MVFCNRDLILYNQLFLYVPQGLTINNSTVCPHGVFMYLYGSENKQRLLPYTTLTDWFL